MNLYIFYPAIALLPCAFMAILLRQRERAHAAKAVELPIGADEKFLRSPGQFALQKKTEFDQKILENLLLIFLSPPCLLTAYLSTPTTQRSSPGFWILRAIVLPIYGCFMAYWFRQLSHFYDKRQDWFLGFRGERAVGEHLNQLLLHGCRVFHDFPLKGKGNLDHIVVARSGVYAVETKARSKKSRLKDNHIVIYDGKKLEFPGWTDTQCLTQAREQADQLSRLLTSAIKTSVKVKPILTFPGWFVDRRGRSDVCVLNHKEIFSAIVETRPILSLDAIEKISAFLDEKCRDVEF
jgi:Nuclease-related domain